MPEGLPQTANERLSKLFREAERVRASRPDLVATFPDVRSWDYWFWFLWHGSREDPKLEALHYPSPPPYLMHRVVGEHITPRTFLDGGALDWRRIHLSLLEGGFDFARGGRVLDFGCGCGRILRNFARYAPICQLVGADVDAGAIEWCRANLDFAKFEALPVRPPSSFPDASFDAVYAFSVFSHLPEGSHRRWLEELHRITRPGAIVVLTVQGQRTIDKMIARRSPSDTPPHDVLQRELPRIDETGFAFYPYQRLQMHDERNQRHFDEWDLEQYGSTFILPKYFFERWRDLFHVVCWSQAPDDWQDYVILRRRAER